MNLILYNKELQKKIGVDIEDYKKASGRYKIVEKNGKGREYKLNTNKLIFEGEYLNWKRNGKGKEYDFDGKLRFEGEYLNGKRNGKGKEYNLIFKFGKHGTNTDDVVVVNFAFCDFDVVDKNTVGAVVVADVEYATLETESSVVRRHGAIVNNNIVVVGTTDRHYQLVEVV